MSILINQIETWMFSKVNEYYDINEFYVNELFNILINWMEQNNYIYRTDKEDLYKNFVEFLYKSSKSSNYNKNKYPKYVL